MPELPEVENERRTFERHAAGGAIRRVDVPDPGIVRNATPSELTAALTGRMFGRPGRLGKWLLCPASGPTLALHFGMTGELVWTAGRSDRHPHDRLILVLPDGELRYRNMRRLGGVWLARDGAELDGLLAGLGPDALMVGREEFLARLRRRRGGIKAALMDQGVVAGIGNLLADEILWQARLHPLAPVDRLGARRRGDLFDTMQGVLRAAVRDFDYLERRHDWLNHVRGEPGAACPRCARPLRRSVAAGRTTYSCPGCQRMPRIRARVEAGSGVSRASDARRGGRRSPSSAVPP